MAGGHYCASLLEAVRREPDATSERVTEAMLWEELRPLEEADGWIRVAIAPQAGYEGWLRRSAVREGCVGVPNAVVVAPFVPLSPWGAEPGACTGGLWMGALVELLESDGVRAALLGPDGERYSVAVCAVRSLDDASDGASPAETVVARARSLLGTPYLWGGMTLRGIDCSGLLHSSYRSIGIRLTRDADTQSEEGTPVGRDDVRIGDAAFFGTERGITHTALMLDSNRIIHAQGASSAVVEGDLDEPWNAEHLAGFRRYV